MSDKPKRILIFNVNWLGDVVFSTAAVRNIRRNFPNGFLACIVPSRCYAVLKDNPHLDEIIIYDEKDRHKGLWAKLKFVWFLRRRRFDTVFFMRRSLSRALIGYLAGIPERVGYYSRKGGLLLTKKIPPVHYHSLHRIDYYLNIIEKAGLKVEDRYTEFFVREEDEIFIDEFLKRHSIGSKDYLALLNPGGNWLPKRWPRYYWAELADRLIEGLGAKIIITGSHKDTLEIHDIRDMIKGKVLTACGAFNLKTFACLCKRADLFVSADTGPLHIANAVGAKKIIALYGPTSAELTGPYPLKNVVILQKSSTCKIPCYILDCADNRCMKLITPQEVYQEISKQRNT